MAASLRKPDPPPPAQMPISGERSTPGRGRGGESPGSNISVTTRLFHAGREKIPSSDDHRLRNINFLSHWSIVPSSESEDCLTTIQLCCRLPHDFILSHAIFLGEQFGLQKEYSPFSHRDSDDGNIADNTSAEKPHNRDRVELDPDRSISL